MNSRRSFMQSFFSLPLLFTFNHNSKVQTTKSILLNQCLVAGFQYYQGKEIIWDLKQNDPILLLAQADNQYDKYAVEVFYQSKKLGYLPKTDNKSISQILQADIKISAKVQAVDITKPAWNAVMVSIYMLV